MITEWTGSVTLAVGQVAVVYAECVMLDAFDVTMAVTVDDPAIVVQCERTGRQFICNDNHEEAVVGIEEVDLSTGLSDARWALRLTYKALNAGVSGVQVAIVSGSAALENITLTAE